MQTLKYKLIKSKIQYNNYCKILEKLIEIKSKEKAIKEEIELLTLLIERWDHEHNTLNDADPVELLKSLMTQKKINGNDLAGILDVSKGLVSDILNYKKSISKKIVRTLAAYFKVSQEAFNRHYTLKTAKTSKLKNVNSSVIQRQKASA
jgi:HTH-type transcriptional regulator/antitoxin HigA